MKTCRRKLFYRREDKGWEGSLGATKFAAATPWKRSGELGGQSRREGRGEVPCVKSFKQIKGNITHIITPTFAPLEKE